MNERKYSKLLSIIAALRGKNGCPWDKKQTHKSLKPYVIEEAYEVVTAIDKGDMDLLKEELGDLLLQVVLHAQLASEKKRFTMQDVIEVLSEKMVRRHPHVFAKDQVRGVKDVLRNWEHIKRQEKNNVQKSFFDGVPRALPALYRAEKVQKKAARVGFDWEHAEGAWKKVREEIREFQEVSRAKKLNKARLAEELGDILFSLVNVARKMHIDAEDALRMTTDKFTRRFEHIDRAVTARKKKLSDCSLKELDALWEESKRTKKRG